MVFAVAALITIFEPPRRFLAIGGDNMQCADSKVKNVCCRNSGAGPSCALCKD